MNVASTSLAMGPYPPPAADSAMQNMKALMEAIKSGDLDSAKSAFEAVSSSKHSVTGRDNPMADFLAQLGTDLEKGDIKGAQEHLSAVDEKMRSSRGGPGGHSSRPGKMDEELTKLFEAVQSGDLTTAQKQLQAVAGRASDNGKGANPIVNLLSAISSALQSGDIGSAQHALSDFGQHLPKGSVVGLSA